MRPFKYTKKEDKITFHYTFSELRKFLEWGFKEGNNGVILIGRDDEFSYYRGFGTIENPWKYIASISMQHDPVYDGELTDPEDIINPPKLETPFTRIGMVIWDASEPYDAKLPISGKIYKDDEEV